MSGPLIDYGNGIYAFDAGYVRPLLALKPYLLRHPRTLVLALIALVVSALAMLSVS